MDNIETQDEALSKAARMKKSRLMKAKGKIIARKREISMKRKRIRFLLLMHMIKDF